MDFQDRIRHYADSFGAFEDILDLGNLPGSSAYFVSPFSLKNIALNMGIRDYERLESLLTSNGINYSKEKKDVGNGLIIEIIKIENENDHENELSLSMPLEMKVEDLFILNLMVESFNYHREKRKSMPVEDAVFQFKNEISIADDLMPPGVMAMVEGRFPDDPAKIVEKIQSNSLPPLFVLMKENQDGFVGFHSILPSLRYNYSSLDQEKIRKALFCEISDAERMPFMNDFNISRTLKGIIFQLEVRKKREFPLIVNDDTKRVLEESGLIILSGRNVKIPDGLKIEEIKERKKLVDENLHKKIERWLSSPSKCLYGTINQQ